MSANLALGAADTQPGVGVKARPMFNVVPVVLSGALLTAVFVFYRLYQGAYAFKYGLDSTSPEFATYWMTLARTIASASASGGGAVVASPATKRRF